MSALTSALRTNAAPARSPLDARREPPLRAVEVGSSRNQRRARPRLLAAIVTVGGMFAILAAQLLLTIATSEGAYEISSLQTRTGELARDEQVLVEQMQVLDAPQHLAAEAHAMGMVNSSSSAYLRLADGAVLGVPTAASASSALLTASDGTSLIPNALLADVPLVGAAGPAATSDAITDPAAGSPVTNSPVTPESLGVSDSPGAPGVIAAEGSVASMTSAGIPSPNTH